MRLLRPAREGRIIKSMKIGILTTFEVSNHGAVLQAYASVQNLKALGADPVLLRYPAQRREKGGVARALQGLSRVVRAPKDKLLWRGQVKAFQHEKERIFRRFVEERLPVGEAYNRPQGLCAAMVGSDMVLDIRRGYTKALFGVGVESPRVFAYAASFGYTDEAFLAASPHREEIVRALSKFGAIGYRDRHTRRLLDSLSLHVPMRETIDPVLLYGFEQERDAWGDDPGGEAPYLLVYAYYPTMNRPGEIRSIRRYARKHGLRIVSCGYFHAWCDASVNASPEMFVRLFAGARAVVTDTFHGSIFAMLFHKPFASILRDNGFKVRHLLDSAGLMGRIAQEGGIAAALDSEIEWTAFDAWLVRARDESAIFLREMAGEDKRIPLFS